MVDKGTADDQYKTNGPELESEMFSEAKLRNALDPARPFESPPELSQHDIDNLFDLCYINQEEARSNVSADRHEALGSLNISCEEFGDIDSLSSRFTLASEGPSSLTESGPSLDYTPTPLAPITQHAPPSKSRRYPIERWNQMKPLLQSLYIHQGISLSEARRILEEEHSFVASEKQYKSKLKFWGLKKYTSRIADQPRPT